MSTIPTVTLFHAIIELLTEAYDGPPNPASTWFIDNEPDSGILGALKGVTAEEASTSVDGNDEPGSTIAGNAEHLRWSLAMMNAAVRGELFQEEWKESWKVRQVDEAGWDRLRKELHTEFETLRQALSRQTNLREDYVIGTIALLPHAAFHLGLIRQMISRVRS
jgi:hypothetical protein